MPTKGDIKTRRKHRARARRVIKKLLEKEGFQPRTTIKFGSRFYIIDGIYDDRDVIFKSCIYPSSYDHLTNEKFGREVLFLRFLQQSHFRHLRKIVPHIYRSGTRPRTWYIREYIEGVRQNINGGNIRFKPSFFSPESLKWVESTIYELHKIKSSDLPAAFKRLLYAPQTLPFLWQFMEPHLHYVEKDLRWKGVGRVIKRYFDKHQKIYHRAPRVLAHQELYSPHIIQHYATYRLIDWENIGWSSITKDPVTVWMRASQSPDWQNQLYDHFIRRYRSVPDIKQLWTITALIQSVFNVIGYHFYPYPQDFKRMASFSKKNIISILRPPKK